MRVVDDRRPIVVTRQKAPAVVMLSLAEYQAMAETLHLLRSPRNAARWHKAVRDAEQEHGARRPPAKRRRTQAA